MSYYSFDDVSELDRVKAAEVILQAVDKLCEVDVILGRWIKCSDVEIDLISLRQMLRTLAGRIRG